ncbi:hypothetical protein BJ742DRAFT_873672 [Cladochytrium replicatum]|nr:hypothetical protein BJ742DRAFT_873672 [Cladochytrium replicatum]
MYTGRAMDIAINSGNLDNLKWTERALRFATARNHLQVVQCWEDSGLEWTNSGNVTVVHVRGANGYKFSSSKYQNVHFNRLNRPNDQKTPEVASQPKDDQPEKERNKPTVVAND